MSGVYNMLSEGTKESIRLFFQSELASQEATAVIRSHKFYNLLGRLGVEGSTADVGWACVYDLQNSGVLDGGIFRGSAGSGVEIPKWDVICSYNCGWSKGVVDDYTLEGVEALERCGRIYCLISDRVEDGGGSVLHVDRALLRSVFQSVKNNDCYRVGGRSLFDQHVGVLLVAGYIEGGIGLSDLNSEWWDMVQKLCVL